MDFGMVSRTLFHNGERDIMQPWEQLIFKWAKSEYARKSLIGSQEICFMENEIYNLKSGKVRPVPGLPSI